MMRQYRHKVFSSTNEIVNFLNEYEIKKEDIISIIPVHSDGFMIYEMVFIEDLV